MEDNDSGDEAGTDRGGRVRETRWRQSGQRLIQLNQGGIWGDTKVRHLLGGPVYAADEEKGKDTGARENCSGVFPIR
jgi:hypothetical protein